MTSHHQRRLYTADDITLYVPFYNAHKPIQLVLEGIKRQSIQPSRVLIVDDGSEPPFHHDLPALLPRGSVLRHTDNRGLSAARNSAINNTETALLASLDADVVPDPTWLESLLYTVNKHHADGVGGRMDERFHTDPGDAWRARHMAQHWGDTENRHPRFLYGCNTLFRTEMLRSCKGYNPDFRTNNEDRTMSEAIYLRGGSLVYTPTAHCEHLRRDSAASVVRGFWQWFHAQGLSDGIFSNKARMITRMHDVNFGIFDYRYNKDVNEQADTCRSIDLLIPWIFCMSDLLLFAQQTACSVPDLARHLDADHPLNPFLQFVTPSSNHIAATPWPEYENAFLTELRSSRWYQRATHTDWKILCGQS